MNPQESRQNGEEAFEGGERFSLSPAEGERESAIELYCMLRTPE